MNKISLNDPLMPHLVDIASHKEATGTILIGGFGLRLKQAHLKTANIQTLISDFPEARATQDIDLMLSIQLWLGDRAGARDFGTMIESLGYEVRVFSWQFRKQLGEEIYVKLDLQARTPREDEPVNVDRREGKVPQVGKKPKTGVSAFETPEGFAVEDSPLTLHIQHGERDGTIQVPHPYAWLNLKMKAAHDWLLETRGELPPRSLEAVASDSDVSTRLKHVFDVYLLTGMLTETELEEASRMAATYAEHEEAYAIREMARELYASPDAPGIVAIRDYARLSFRTDLEINHDLFFNEGLRPALGL